MSNKEGCTIKSCPRYGMGQCEIDRSMNSCSHAKFVNRDRTTPPNTREHNLGK